MNERTAESLLSALEAGDAPDLADTLRQIIDWLRPPPSRPTVAAVVTRIEQLALALEDRPSIRDRLRERLEAELESARHLTLYTEIGLYSRKGFVREFRELVIANARRNSLRSLWQENMRLLARSITQQASETGEHYITTNRAEYLQMFRSGAGAGLIIAFMALIKIEIEAMGLGPGLNTFWVCLNYGLGFVLIHILSFTVATKQPAMTAARLAAAIEETEKGIASPDRLADLLIQVGRSQLVAVLGNVSVALPVAVGVGWLYGAFLEAPVLDAAQAQYQLHKLTPFAGLALFHAAIAGVWLFVAGLISGFFDNRCAYMDLPGRLRGHPLLSRFLSVDTRERFAGFIDHNYGALAGNFFFGVLLGITAYLGYLLSLPLDIQHVAFGSANLGYAATSHAGQAAALLPFLVFVLLIGAVNLWVRPCTWRSGRAARASGPWTACSGPTWLASGNDHGSLCCRPHRYPKKKTATATTEGGSS